MRDKYSRKCSFLILTAVYILAFIIGLVTYKRLDGALWLRLLIADIAATIVTFIFSLVFRNASVYDPYWSVQPMAIYIAFAASTPMTAASILLLIVITMWGLRLTANWAYTFHGMAHQDWRYTMLKKETGKAYPLINFVGIHMVPTLIVYACQLPALTVLLSGAQLNIGGVLGCIISLGAATLQGTADIQMHRFRKNKTGGFNRNGVWKNSRHPNYLGEILMWWGVAIASVSMMPERWYMIAGASANTALFLCVSIPMADKRQSRKEGFAQYKKETRRLLPIPKRSKNHSGE